MENKKKDEIVSLIKAQIESYNTDIETKKFGTVISVGDFIATIYGLDEAMAGELLKFEGDVYGMALNIEKNSIGAIILGDQTKISEGSKVYSTQRILEVPVGKELLGRVVSPLGEPLDGKGEIKAKKARPIESKATSVIERQSVNTPLETGIKMIDALIPVGRGQRELIIGDRQTGKTTIAIDTIINQKGKNVFCVYVAIGQKESTIASLVETLTQAGAMEYTVVVASASSDPASLQYIAPYAGCAIGEEFMFAGKDALIVYDDLSKHATAYREISLLLHRPPGREAYPGDIFYLHSRLLERAARLSESLGGGSLTALPIIETQEGDFSAYIPTNVISITDGQIYLDSNLFHSGIRPSVDAGLSVSRVGGAAQTKAIKSLSGTLRLDLASFKELEAFTQFGSDLDEATLAKLSRGKKATLILTQGAHKTLKMEEEALSLFCLVKGHLDSIDEDRIKEFEESLRKYFYSCEEGLNILKDIASSKRINNEENISLLINQFKETF